MRSLPAAPCIALTASLFATTAFFVMANGHLHEDAYILFQYSRNLSQGDGITFDQVSGAMEGATDFLWMALLGLMARVLDIGSSAAVLNTLGLVAIGAVLAQLRTRRDAIFGMALLAVLLSGGASAALGGFSTLAYGGLYAGLTWAVVRRQAGFLVLFLILIALFRPDGVLLALGAYVAYAAFAPRQEWKQVATIGLLAALVGGVYFAWRLNYFGEVLPLPLMVKQKADRMLEGLSGNFSAVWPYLFLLVATFFYRSRIDRPTAIAIALGPALLFVALSFAHQSQNIGHRFQFVIILAIVFLFAVAMPPLHGRLVFLALLPLAGVIRGVERISSDIPSLTNRDYINSFPQVLRQEGFRVPVLAVTEAGRFPFWFDAPEMIDLIGLNSRSVVRQGVDSTLEARQPAVVFVHHAGRFEVDAPADRPPFFVTSPEAIRVKPYAGKNPVFHAPVPALAYAKRHGFRAVMVTYGRRDREYSHVYFLHPNLDRVRFERALARSFETKTSYYTSLAWQVPGNERSVNNR